jgi:RimJ/RimL family protein N-acetyltransferase
MDLDAADLLRPVEISAGRFLLRPPSPHEAEDLYAMFEDPLTRMWNPNHHGDLQTVEEVRAWCEKWADWNGGAAARFSIVDPAGGRLLGNITLRDVNRLTLAGSLGYNTAPWARGMGVATAALRGVADWAFGSLGLVRLELCHGVGNAASCGVARRAGFRLEGELRQ